MTVPGYDPKHLDDCLDARLDRREIRAFLTDEEAERRRDGGALIELLEGEDIRRLVDHAGGEASAG